MWCKCKSCGLSFQASKRYEFCRDCTSIDVDPSSAKYIVRRVENRKFFEGMSGSANRHGRKERKKDDVETGPLSRAVSMDKIVQCKSFGCSWTGALRDLAKHRKEHEWE